MKRKSKKMYKFVILSAFQGFDGDGLSCKSVVGCHINPIVCDPNADCVLIDGVHQCLCRKHFFGDGHTCTGKRCQFQRKEPKKGQFCIISAVPIYEGNVLISSQGFALMKFNLEERTPGTSIIVKSFMTAAGIDFDCYKGQVCTPYKS